MTPTQLRAFHLVAESGSFSAAARASGLSQPNLSGQVTALEKAYGVRLFDRRGRTVAPTETGRQLHGVTTRLFALQDEARALLAGEQALTRGHLRIAADSAHHVVPIMAALRKRAEGLTFALSIDNSAVVLERLLRHEADVAVMAKSVSDPRLHALRLRTDRLVLFVPARHPLAKSSRVSLEAVAAGFGIGAVFASELGDDRRFRRILVTDTDLGVAEYAVSLQERLRVALVRAFMDEATKLSS